MIALRIAIVGISGSGKSIFGRKLAEKTGLSLIHMDQLFWKANWEAVLEPEYLAQHAEIIQREQWIIEGYIDAKMSDRAKRADLIIYLDYSGPRCAWQVFKRWLKHQKNARPELDNEATEQLKWPFPWMVFKGGEKQDIEEALRSIEASKIYRVKNRTESEKIIESL